LSEPLSDAQRRALGGADLVTFTSSSTVRFFFEQAGGAIGPRTRLASIGPVTSETLREHGREPDLQAARHDIDGLVEAIVADAGARAGT
jgi:uroporphyrinogen III methyltransferase / synthase